MDFFIGGKPFLRSKNKLSSLLRKTVLFSLPQKVAQLSQ